MTPPLKRSTPRVSFLMRVSQKLSHEGCDFWQSVI